MIKIQLLTIFLLVLLATSVSAAEKNTLKAVKGKPPAPEFDLQDIDENRHRLSQYRGKVVIINFWASWCPPCRYEMPSMEKAYQALRQEGIEILAINIGEDADTIFKFTADYNVTFPLLMDLDSAIIKQWPVMALPTSFVISPEGKIIYRAVGGRDWHHENIVKKLKALR
jgi:peroxiredoxin